MIEGTIGYPTSVIALFGALVVAFVVIDLYAHRRDKPVRLLDAVLWSILWVAVSLGFYGYLFWQYGVDRAALFLAGYALEKVLSVDNLMVFVAIFTAFSIPEGYRHRVLYFGVIGAVVFRLVFVTAGASIYAIGPWVEFVFAAIIAWTAVKMLQQGGGEGEIADYTHHWSVRLTQRIIPVYPKLVSHSFFLGRRRLQQELAKPENSEISVVRKSALYATPLLLCLICVEVADVLFAFDSVPAVIAVTRDPLLVYSAMIFAILGLRSMYFVLAALQKYLVHLGKAVICLLFFIAFKLCLSASNEIFHWPGITISPNLSLLIVLGVLVLGVVASFVFKEAVEKNGEERAAEIAP